jgi:hypothetical protein
MAMTSAAAVRTAKLRSSSTRREGRDFIAGAVAPV